ncbi:MotA/TolQ/ExbB proton channel family protein [Desulfolutivibrio sulfoxidireducens]|uniref:MotA/TolQ/ExbB proton channel family protein n=1 Tax=Desulfolutivibrio sulfoxidireducens TaxID=2773299 RepID=UPI00159E1454|nr:MotA/TolQ/ExbB proton channel family protein [Desulfolutivibrio sulfoxidireducens]QLA17865.1 protein TolQ [Desulfolutivibrio sulfoxidireducens]
MDLVPHMDVWAMIREATPTVKWVMVLLAAMSVLSWAVILHKLFTLVPAAMASRAALAEALAAFSGRGDVTAALDLVARRPRAPLARAATAASAVLASPGWSDGSTTQGRPDAGQALAVAQAAALAGATGTRGLERGVGLLAACSGAAPFIGLFGTVWGVMHAFHALGQVQTAALALVGPGIAEALVATALGLAVAVPANVAFNIATSLLDGLETDQDAFEKALALRLETPLAGGGEG